MGSGQRVAQHHFPLGATEASELGWDPSVTVVSARSPDGRRSIPTRQVHDDGSITYGEILTYEPPPGRAEDEWDENYGIIIDWRAG